MTTDLIFDFFGTLVQYTAGPFHTSPYERTHAYLDNQGFTMPYETFVALYTDASTACETRAQQTAVEYHMNAVAYDFFRTAFEIEPSEEVIEGFVRCFIDEWSRGITYFDSIQPWIAQLATRYRLSVLSNTHFPPLILMNLESMGIAPFFNQIVTSVEFGYRKPHASIFGHVLGRLGIPASKALYIGDTYTDDYEGATAAGVRCVLIDPHGRYTHLSDRISSLFHLETYLRGLEHNTR